MSRTKLVLFLVLAMSLFSSTSKATRLRIAAWNTFNRPNNAEHESLFGTILQAVGDEVVAGIAQRVDVLAVSETDTGSAQDLVDLMNAMYGVSSYAVVTSSSVGGDRTGIVYDTSSVQLVSSKELVTGLTHPIVRAQFQPVNAHVDMDFFVYSVHLKSGRSATTRANEAGLMRADANALGDGQNIIYMGDFNMLGSSEGAWAKMGDIGNGQAFDVAESPGEWRDNLAFSGLHTQHPGAAMDDRFDLMFVTDEMLDGTGIHYLAGSYRVFGNNGMHTLNGRVDSGSGAATTVLAALAAASDHLPIVADYSVPEPSALFLAGLAVILVGEMRFALRIKRVIGQAHPNQVA